VQDMNVMIMHLVSLDGILDNKQLWNWNGVDINYGGSQNGVFSLGTLYSNAYGD